jgi:hypothetical protein
MFWKRLKSAEYLALKKEISLMQIDIDALLIRKKRNIKQKEPKDLPEETQGFDDGFNDLRKLHKDALP